MRIWFDTEFIEDGKTIDLVSIGMVREDGEIYYAVSSEFNPVKASPWVMDNVLVHIYQDTAIPQSREWIKSEILKFAGDAPEFWGYYADYDWVVLCQLFGRMIDLPPHWPKFCRDIKQLALQVGDPDLPPQDVKEHHALWDALWNQKAWLFLNDAVRKSLIR